MQLSSRTYRSRVDAWLWLAALAPLLALWLIISIGPGPDRIYARPFLICVLCAVLLLLSWTLLATCYTIDAQYLSVRCGPLRWRILLKDIRGVTATRDPRTGPALSLDRLRIDYRGGAPMLVSPADKSAFLADLRARGVATGAPLTSASR
jgi:hypothetical protein